MIYFKSFVTAVLLFLVLTGLQTNSQWNPSNKGLPPPKAGQGKFPNFRALAVNGTTVFAGTTQGMFLSNDNGASWVNASSGLPKNIVVTDITSVGANTFISTEEGVFYSANNGKSWISASNGLPENPYLKGQASEIKTVAICGNVILAGCWNQKQGTKALTDGGVYCSEDNGKSWHLSDTGIRDAEDGFNSNGDINKIVVDGKKIYALSQQGVFLSEDNVKSWKKINSKYNPLAFSGNKIYGGTWGAGVFISKNSGATFSEINNGLPKNELYVTALAVSGSTLIAGISFDGNLYVSRNDGVSWQKDGPPKCNAQCILIAGNTIIVGTNNGVLINKSILKK